MAGALSYLCDPTPAPGTLVRVPLGQREWLGVVWDPADCPGAAKLDPLKLRPVTAVLSALPPLSSAWRRLIEFAAGYYQRATGEVALAALPPQLRDLSSAQLARRLQKLAKAAANRTNNPSPAITGR